MLDVAEQLAIALQGQHVAVGIDALLIEQVEIQQVIAHLVGRIAEHQDDLLCALGDAAQADGEAVAAEDREDHADGFAAELGTHVVSNVVNGGVVALRAGDNRFGHGDDVTIARPQSVLLHRFHNGTGDDLHQVVPLADNGRTHAHGNSTDHSAHNMHSSSGQVHSRPCSCMYRICASYRICFNIIQQIDILVKQKLQRT